MGSLHSKYLTSNKVSCTVYFYFHTCIYRFKYQQPFARKGGWCSTNAGRPDSPVWMDVVSCLSAWQAVCVCPILRTTIDHKDIRQPAWQACDSSNFKCCDWPLRYVVWLIPFYVYCSTCCIHQIFVRWNLQDGEKRINVFHLIFGITSERLKIFLHNYSTAGCQSILELPNIVQNKNNSDLILISVFVKNGGVKRSGCVRSLRDPLTLAEW